MSDPITEALAEGILTSESMHEKPAEQQKNESAVNESAVNKSSISQAASQDKSE